MLIELMNDNTAYECQCSLWMLIQIMNVSEDCQYSLWMIIQLEY